MNRDDEIQLPWVDEDAIAASNPTLFHYTKVDRFEKILETGLVFGTHYRHTNDATELRAAANPFVEMVRAEGLALAKQRRAEGVFNREMDDFALAYHVAGDAKSFHNAMLQAMPTPVFLTCFARHSRPNHHANGLLTLWRFYGGEGEGVAMGFNTRTLIARTGEIRDALALNSLHLDTVGYGDEDGIVRARLSQAPGLASMFLEYLDSTLVSRPVELGQRRDELYQFIVLASGSKHADFVDEREVRLIAIPSMKPDPQKRPRPETKGGKHIELPFTDALEKVLIGPSPIQDEIESRVRGALDKAGRGDISVLRSRTPFVFTRN